jgi:hypothetical protein
MGMAKAFHWNEKMQGMEKRELCASGARHLTPLLRGAMVPQSAINVGANVEMRCAR